MKNLHFFTLSDTLFSLGEAFVNYMIFVINWINLTGHEVSCLRAAMSASFQ